MTSRLQLFDTELLTQPGTLVIWRGISRDLIAKADVIDSGPQVVLDMGSSAPGKAWERRMV